MNSRALGLCVLVSTLVVLTSVGPVGGETLEIALPQLVGVYPGPSAEVTVVLQQDFAGKAIVGAALRVSGTVTVGLVECLDGTSSNYPMELSVWMGDSFPESYRSFGFIGDEDPAVNPGDTIAFDALRSLSPGPRAAGWEFFEDGESPLTLLFAPPPIIGICGVAQSSSGTITAASLLVEVQSAVPVSTSSWGRIKAVY